MDQSSTDGRLVRTVRLEDEQVARILDELDAVPTSSATDRRAPRYGYRMKALVVHLQQPGFATPVRFLVPSRNLSAEGLSVLHGGFVYPGTRCMVQLITAYGTWNDVAGRIARCRYIEGNIHEVAIRFDQRIDPAVYCPQAVRSRVLLAEDDNSIARLVTFNLRQLNCDVDRVADGKEALDKALKNTYDLILLDIDLPGMDGFAVAKELRTRGYSGTIAAGTGLTQPEDRQRCLEAGCDTYLPKPYTRDDLATLLESQRQEPLFSSFHDDPSMRDLINAFVVEVPARVRLIEEALVAQDVQKLRQVARALKSEGRGYGFEVITEVAAQVEGSLIQGTVLDDVRKDVERLVKLCTQVRRAGQSNDAALDEARTKRNATPPRPPTSS